MGRVVVFGSVNVDLVVPVERHPRPGETVLAQGPVERFAGGKGANQAVAAAGAGADVVLVGAVGDDDAGRAYADRLASLGIRARLSRVAGAVTGTAWITVDPAGENAIVVVPGANAQAVAQVEDLRPGDVLLCQLELPVAQVERAVRRAGAVGARVVLNAAPFAAVARDVASLADPLVVNEHEAGALADSGLVPGSLLVTFGAAGAQWDDVRVDAKAVPADEVVDTTGAGDAFCGALAAALATGADRHTALVRASEAAAEAVRRTGAQPNPGLDYRVR
ncbi:MAG: PfkB family carbohydrate kinase [Dermatophilaceae bacterium]